MALTNQYPNTGFKQKIEPVTLQGYGVKLVPLCSSHVSGIAQAATDGQLWCLRVTSVPEPSQTESYIQAALDGQKNGHMLPFTVVNESDGRILGSTRYHDILTSVARLEIGYTWYAKSVQRTHVNTACKLLLLTHAFDHLGANVVGWRTDIYNFASQKAIERLGAHKDGVIQGDALRRDATVRSTVMYSLRKGEWPDIHAHLMHRLLTPRSE